MLMPGGASISTTGSLVWRGNEVMTAAVRCWLSSLVTCHLSPVTFEYI